VRAAAHGITAVVSIALATLVVLAVPARGGPQGSVLIVNQTTAGPQDSPSTAWISGGTWATTWLSGTSVMLRTSSSNEQLVNTDGSTPTSTPTVSMGGDGRFVVVWPATAATAGGPVPIVAARFFAVDGTPLTNTFNVTSTANAIGGASVSTYASGTALVAWVTWQEQTSFGSLWARKVSLDTSGGPVLEPAPTSLAGVPLTATAPRVSVDASGDAAVVWEDTATGSVELLAYDPIYEPLGALQIVGVGTSPAVTRASFGATVVAWAGPSASDPDGVLARGYDANGAPTSNAFQANTATGGAQSAPTVGISGNGRFVVAWLGPSTNPPGQAGWFQRFEGDRSLIGRETRLTPTDTMPTSGPLVSMAGDGSYLAAWPGNGAADNQGIYQLPFTFDDVPIGQQDAYSVGHDSTLVVPTAQGVLANDTDNDGDALTVSIAAPPTLGQLALNPDGSFTYTPNPGVGSAADASDEFEYFVSDGRTQSTADVALTITATNLNAPVAHDDSYTTPQGQQLAVPAPGVLGNDTDADGDPLTAGSASQPTAGSVQLFADGSFIYAPPPTFCGPDSFTYTTSDGVHTSPPATVTVLVPCVEAAPEALPDGYSTPTGATLNVPAPGVLGNDRDANLDQLVAHLLNGPTHGTVDLHTDGGFVYTPQAGFVGSDAFTYEADDGQAVSAPATVTIAVGGAGGPLVANGDSYAVDEGGVLTTPAPGVLANDQGSGLKASLGEQPAHGVLRLNADGSFVYAPTAGYTGDDSFAYFVEDASAFRAPATVAISVHPTTSSTNFASIAGSSIVAIPAAGTAPPAGGPPATIPQPTAPGAAGSSGGGAGATGGDGAGATGGPSDAANAGGGDVQLDHALLDIGAGKDDAVSVPTPPQHGSAVATPARTIAYQPSRHFTGRDEFSYSVCHGDGSCATDTAGVTVVSQPDGSRRIVFDQVASNGGRHRPGWLLLALLLVVGIAAIALVLPLARKVLPAPGGVRPPEPPRRPRIPKVVS
jgi:hypothetical protein